MTLKLRLHELIEEKSVRENRTITQKTVAAESGVSEGVLSRYANGFSKSFQHDVIEKLMDYFEVGFDELVYRDKDKVG